MVLGGFAAGDWVGQPGVGEQGVVMQRTYEVTSIDPEVQRNGGRKILRTIVEAGCEWEAIEAAGTHSWLVLGVREVRVVYPEGEEEDGATLAKGGSAQGSGAGRPYEGGEGKEEEG